MFPLHFNVSEICGRFGAGQLKDLSQPQRERVLAFLLEKLLILEGSDSEILGLVRPTSTSIVLPDMKHMPLPKGSDGFPATISNPIAAAMNPEGANAARKVPITPPPMTISPYWGDSKGTHAFLSILQRHQISCLRIWSEVHPSLHASTKFSRMIIPIPMHELTVLMESRI
jgi:hypothetical protein